MPGGPLLLLVTSGLIPILRKPGELSLLEEVDYFTAPSIHYHLEASSSASSSAVSFRFCCTVLNSTLLKKLESFQCKVGRRILRLPKTAANNIVRMSLLWPSIRARILCNKLGFLLKIHCSSRVFRSLAADNVESLVLVKQCRLLEAAYGSLHI